MKNKKLPILISLHSIPFLVRSSIATSAEGTLLHAPTVDGLLRLLTPFLAVIVLDLSSMIQVLMHWTESPMASRGRTLALAAWPSQPTTHACAQCNAPRSAQAVVGWAALSIAKVVYSVRLEVLEFALKAPRLCAVVSMFIDLITCFPLAARKAPDGHPN